MQTLIQHIVATLNANNIPYAVSGPVWFTCKEEFSKFYKGEDTKLLHNLGVSVLVSPANFKTAIEKLKDINYHEAHLAVQLADKQLKTASDEYSTMSLLFKQTGGINIRKSVNFHGIYFEANCDSFYKTDTDPSTGVSLLKPIDQLIWMLTEYHYGHYPELIADQIDVLIDVVMSNPDAKTYFKECCSSPLSMLLIHQIKRHQNKLKEHGIVI